MSESEEKALRLQLDGIEYNLGLLMKHLGIKYVFFTAEWMKLATDPGQRIVAIKACDTDQENGANFEREDGASAA